MLSASSFRKLVSDDKFEISFYTKENMKLLVRICSYKKGAPKSEFEDGIVLWNHLKDDWVDISINSIRHLKLPKVSFNYHDLVDLAIKLGEGPLFKESEQIKKAIIESKKKYGKDL